MKTKILFNLVFVEIISLITNKTLQPR